MRILICPLNWGLGHASRCIPIIHKLTLQGHEVVIVADGYPLQLLQLEFPQLSFLQYPSYSISYSDGKSQIFAMLKCLPNIMAGVVKEHYWLKKLLVNEYFDQVISDNRFGLWSKKTHSIYITHQLMIKMPNGIKWLEPIGWMLHQFIINQYNECWVPDNPTHGGLSGDLSHKYPLPKHTKFIGTQSRFSLINGLTPNAEYHTVAILSGIESQRQHLEQQIIEKNKNEAFRTLIVAGKPSAASISTQIANVTIISHVSTLELANYLLGCNKIICRSGYSTIMDLHTLGCLHKAELIPTPGQTEQEYLAEYHLDISKNRKDPMN